MNVRDDGPNSPGHGESLIEALVAAVTMQPANAELRAHAVELLLAAGRGTQALDVVREGLRHAPGDARLLALAARAAVDIHDHGSASRYRMLASAGHDATLAGPSSDASVPIVEPANRWITLADVAGLTDVKAQLERSFLAPLRHPELRAAFAKRLRGGLLLWGPPGCGKTHVARALAGELELELVSVSADDILSRWLGETEHNLAAVFAEARRKAPCVVFFDELDALGRRRSSIQNDTMRTTVNQLLDELDGIRSHDNEGLFVIGATNAPWDIDPALRRPGRLDRTIFVPPPDRDARRALLGIELLDRPVAPGIDLDRLAAQTEGLSGADIAHLVSSAVDLALEESITAGRVVAIDVRHFDVARRSVSSSVSAWASVAATAAQYTDDDTMFAPFLSWSRRRGGR